MRFCLDSVNSCNIIRGSFIAGTLPRVRRMKKPSAEEPIRAFSRPKQSVPVATQVRSTWLTSSLRALRERNCLDRYYELLPREHHDRIRSLVAGSWIPMQLAIVHYEACEGLQLTSDVIMDIGRDVTRFAHRTSYSLALRLATTLGVTPWS